jgi:hypothetical protein
LVVLRGPTPQGVNSSRAALEDLVFFRHTSFQKLTFSDKISSLFLRFFDTLPTFTNLKRWGKRASVNCHLYGNTVKQMLFHVLLHCNHTMDQERITWRHDCVLKHIAGSLKSALKNLGTVEVYCDLEGLQAPVVGSIPVLVMVILDRSVHGRY